ncbi:hypothetical protein AMECASPLE_007069 [Ameca splendens]|uniref:Uncharacterized protein n=1 Tax=Ameca splendens TaxID=208324 RepID=A0ABV0ZXL0_9TELE
MLGDLWFTGWLRLREQLTVWCQLKQAIKRIHRGDLRPCVAYVPVPGRKGSVAPSTNEVQAPADLVKVSTDSEYVVLEEAPYLDVDPGFLGTESLGDLCDNADWTKGPDCVTRDFTETEPEVLRLDQVNTNDCFREWALFHLYLHPGEHRG